MCGVGGSIGSEDIVYQSMKIFNKLQSRGQDAAGFGTIDHDGSDNIVKRKGLVKDVFKLERLKQLKGPVGVWHTRYRTIGGTKEREAQPHRTFSRYDRYTIIGALNGNIQNCPQLRDQLKKHGFYFRSENDGEVLIKTLAHYLGTQTETDFIEKITNACGKTMDSLKGAYTAVVAIYDRSTEKHYLVAFTDPRKIRPGVVGMKDRMYAVASESNALELNGFRQIRDLLPGEVFIVTADLRTFSKIARVKQRKHCFFEYVYFGNPNHVGEGLEINDVRFKLGKQLAMENPDLKEHIDIVMPMPFTAIPAAAGFAEVMKKPLRQGIIKDRYAGRIFIMPERQERNQAAEENIEIILSIVNEKRVCVVDDSIVKGTQSPRLVKKLSKAGAKEIIFCISCPPIINTCDKGIYIPKHEELVAYQRSVAEIQEQLQKKSDVPVTLRYISLQGLLSILTTPHKKYLKERISDGRFSKMALSQTRSKNDFCLACITKDDPTAEDTGGLIE